MADHFTIKKWIKAKRSGALASKSSGSIGAARKAVSLHFTPRYRGSYQYFNRLYFYFYLFIHLFVYLFIYLADGKNEENGV